VLFVDELALHICCTVKASVPWSKSLYLHKLAARFLGSMCIPIDLE
jgi:hypothetical protein